MNAEQRYEPVADTLAAGGFRPDSVAKLPPVSREQALRVRDAIVRHFFEPKGLSVPWGWDGTGREPRRVWISKTPTRPRNSSKGLGRLVHDLSHALFEATYRGKRRAHDPLHARYEIEMAEWVATSPSVAAILAPPKPKAPKVKPTAQEKRSRKLALTVASIKRWESKAKRAATALRKLRARERGLKRAMLGVYSHERSF
jgi:hypothetical protein